MLFQPPSLPATVQSWSVAPAAQPNTKASRLQENLNRRLNMASWVCPFLSLSHVERASESPESIPAFSYTTVVLKKKDKKNRNETSYEAQPVMADKLRDFKDLKLIGKGSFGRVYRAIRYSDGQE